MIAVGSSDRPDYDYGDGVTLHLYEFEDRARTPLVIPSRSGDIDLRFDVRREGQTIIVERHRAAKPWQLVLVGIEAVASVDGATAERASEGTLAKPAHTVDHLSIKLNNPV